MSPAELYYYMCLTRSLEERLVILKRQGRVPGGVFRSLGQEGAAVGTAAGLDFPAGDVMCPLIRGLGAVLTAGVPPVQVLRQYLASARSPTRGVDLHICFSDLDRGVLGHIAPLGVMLPVMAGVALSFQKRGEQRVALVQTGEGTLSTGPAHEGINFAAVRRLPLVIVAERNGYAYSTPAARQSAVASLVDRALAYGMAAGTMDGNDVLGVRRAVAVAVARARRGEGTFFLELVTYRRSGHAEHDDQRYVPAGEVAEWEARDPLEQHAGWLRRNQGWEPEAFVEVEERVRTELDEAVEQVLAEPAPAGPRALEGVYAGISARLPGR